MSDADWELFRAQYADLLGQLRERDAKVEALEARVETLERALRDRSPEAEVYGERPVLRIAEPEQIECGRCDAYHSPELPCAAEAEDFMGAPV